MKILALGATGAIGREVIAMLDPLQHEIYVTTRSARNAIGLVRYVQGDAQEDTFLLDLLSKEWDVIIDFMVYDTQTFRRRVSPLLGAAKQYIFVSSARVFADSADLLTERSSRILDVPLATAFSDNDEYALTKARQEDLLRQSGCRNWTIVRPYITFGSGRLQLGSLEKESWLYRALQRRSIIFCKPLVDKWTTMTDGQDVARMIAALVGHGGALGEDYNLASAKAVTWQQVLTTYLDVLEAHLGRRPRVSLLGLDDFCGTVRSPTPVRYDRIYNRRFDTSKINLLVDPGSIADPLPALRQRLKMELCEGTIPVPDWSTEGLRDKAAGELASLVEIPSTRERIAYLSHRYLPDYALRMLRPK